MRELFFKVLIEFLSLFGVAIRYNNDSVHDLGRKKLLEHFKI